MQLSIIIPCYNCEKTLRESVESCYRQKLSLSSFEIIMVDDGSRDGTKLLMESLAQEHSEIRLFFHPQNRGGGAARNTGIRASQGQIVYCLDSDNVFADDSVRPMLDFVTTHNLDGAAFYERRFFMDTDKTNYSVHINTVLDRVVNFGDLFNETNTLLDNFFFTRTAYNKTSGYPEHHGFDTQCYEMRFLLAGNTVRVVPGTYFWHRQGMSEPSYFERVHNSGLFSVNYMLMFEEFFHLFTPDTLQTLITYPLFSTNKSYGDNIIALVRQRHLARSAFKVNVTDHAEIVQKKSVGNDAHETLLLSVTALQEQNYLESWRLLAAYVAAGRQPTPYLQFLSLRILEGIAGTPYAAIPKRVLSGLKDLEIKPVSNRFGLFTRIIKRFRFLYNLLTRLRHRVNKPS